MLHETGIVALSDVLRNNWQGNEYTFSDEDYSTLVWHDGNKDPKPTEEEVNAATASLQAEYDAQDYARKRQAEYPTIEECVHAILDDDLENLQILRQAVKNKFPKENS